MGVNNVNGGSPTLWSSLNSPLGTETIDAAKAIKPMNLDKVELNLPVSETIYKRKEFVTDERMAEGCAFCYTYMERTLTFAEGKGDSVTFVSGSRDGVWLINLDGSGRTFGKSGANMNDLSHAVEETWERRERSAEQATVSVGISGMITGNGQTVGGALGFSAQSTVHRYSSVSTTQGTLAYKNGAAGKYRVNTVSSREIYNKCASFLAEVFGEKDSELTLSGSLYNELFGKQSGDEKNFTKNAAQKREKLNTQLGRLKEFMEKKLAAIRKKDPDCASLRIFADTYLKLGEYNISDIAAFAEKMFAAENTSASEE